MASEVSVTREHKQGVERWREDFPILARKVYDRDMAYFDSASSAQKPAAVIQAMNEVMLDHYANIHRGLYYFSHTTTSNFEAVRPKVARFIGADNPNEVIFTRNATEGLNLLASCLGEVKCIQSGDEIILTQMEHHANIVPWRMLAEKTGAVIKYIPVDKSGQLDLQVYRDLLTDKTKIVSCVHVSNVLGTINNINKIVDIAKTYNKEIVTIIDGAQGAVHGEINVNDIGCDFYVFTGHKLYGPTGIGVLWGRYDQLEVLPPYQGGGDMIETVTFDSVTYKPPPSRFEAGTPAFVEVIGLGAAIDYIQGIGVLAIGDHERHMTSLIYDMLETIDGLTLYGPNKDKENRAGVFSFAVDWGHPSDVAMILDQSGVAVRSGHHCCMPLMSVLGVDATIRASIGLYTNENDVELLRSGLVKAKELLG